MAVGIVKHLRHFQLLIVLFMFNTYLYHLVSSSTVQTTIPSPFTISLSVHPLSCNIWAANNLWRYQLCHGYTNLQGPSMPANYKCICGRDFTQPWHLSWHESTCEDQQKQTKNAYKRRQNFEGRKLKQKKLEDDDRNRTVGLSRREIASSSKHEASSSHVSFISQVT